MRNYRLVVQVAISTFLMWLTIAPTECQTSRQADISVELYKSQYNQFDSALISMMKSLRSVQPESEEALSFSQALTNQLRSIHVAQEETTNLQYRISKRSVEAGGSMSYDKRLLLMGMAFEQLGCSSDALQNYVDTRDTIFLKFSQDCLASARQMKQAADLL